MSTANQRANVYAIVTIREDLTVSSRSRESLLGRLINGLGTHNVLVELSPGDAMKAYFDVLEIPEDLMRENNWTIQLGPRDGEIRRLLLQTNSADLNAQ